MNVIEKARVPYIQVPLSYPEGWVEFTGRSKLIFPRTGEIYDFRNVEEVEPSTLKGKVIKIIYFQTSSPEFKGELKWLEINEENQKESVESVITDAFELAKERKWGTISVILHTNGSVYIDEEANVNMENEEEDIKMAKERGWTLEKILTYKDNSLCVSEISSINISASEVWAGEAKYLARFNVKDINNEAEIMNVNEIPALLDKIIKSQINLKAI